MTAAGVPWAPPPLREKHRTLRITEAAGTLPDFPNEADLRIQFHGQTSWIRVGRGMAEQAFRLGIPVGVATRLRAGQVDPVQAAT